MSNEGTKARERFLRNMEDVAAGAKLARSRFTWVVVRQRRLETTVELHLHYGRRALVVNVGVCHTGPCLADVGLRPLAPAPMQRELAMSEPA